MRFKERDFVIIKSLAGIFRDKYRADWGITGQIKYDLGDDIFSVLWDRQQFKTRTGQYEVIGPFEESINVCYLKIDIIKTRDSKLNEIL